ncbi:AfsR/SARP family transcriptional regulator [Streptomyces microflavus]
MTVSEEEVARVEFQVLGPLQVRADGNRVPLPGARRQRLLAGLLTAPNSLVPMGRLIETVFGDEPPDTAVKQVQNSVSALRERLHDSQRRLIVTEESGYRICVRENALDSLQFTKRLADSRRHAAEDDFDQAISMIGSALSLWRGPALDGLVSEALSGPAARLEEQRLGALELSARWRLEVGQHQEVVDELGDLVSSYPLCEGLHAQLITALARCGRRAEALHAFHRLSTSLVQELGVGPGAGLQRLHQQILAGHSQPSQPPRPRRDGTRPGTPLPLPGYPPPSRCLQLPDNFRTLFETSRAAPTT